MCNLTATQFAQTIPQECIEKTIQILARRSAGRQAILNSPIVVRAITSNRREVKRDFQSKRGETMLKMAAKASQAKGRATKVTNKLCSVKARNKGLRTMLTKVRI